MHAKSFAAKLIAWQRRHGRHDLPWQRRRTPYRVWVSEIMLQQTQVETVIPYYSRFLRAFPTIKRLAQTDLDAVLSLWSGLGYYRRARFLHQAAQLIVDRHGGRFPTCIEQVMQLPGIGRSTAGAILSLALDQPHPVVDGNVQRVLCRFHALTTDVKAKTTRERLWQEATAYTQAAASPSAYTQAIMDLGATLCTRSQPNCLACPVTQHCKAKQRHIQQELPVTKARAVLPQRATRMLLITDRQGRLLLEKRPATGVWPDLWSLPQCSVEADIRAWSLQQLGVILERIHPAPSLRHTFSHYHLHIQPVIANAETVQTHIAEQARRCWLNPQECLGLGLPAPVAKLIRQLIVSPSPETLL